MPTRKTTKAIDPLDESAEWKTVQRPRLHAYGNDIQKLILSTEANRKDIEELTHMIKDIVGNGEEGIIDKKDNKIRDEMTRDVSLIVEAAMRKYTDEKNKEQLAEWNKLKWIIIGAMVALTANFIYFYAVIAPGLEK